MDTAATAPKLSIFDRLATLSDPLRCRILLLLSEHELTVSELCESLQLPQSTVSRHLKVLRTDGWLEARREGTSRHYYLRSHDESAAENLWELIRGEYADHPAPYEDRRRLEGVLARRRSKSRTFFSTAAQRWAQLRRELYGPAFDLEGLLPLLDPAWTVVDLGAGTGQVASSIAPFVRQVIAVDESPEMLAAAAERTGGLGNVELRHGKAESLPLDTDSADAAIMILALHYIAEPEAVFAEAKRVLKPGAPFVLLDMQPHANEELYREMGHVWLGFSAEQIERWYVGAGFNSVHYHPLLPANGVKGPPLFAARGCRT